MTDSPDEIGPWFKMEPRYEFQHELWRCGEDGTVLAIEARDQPWFGDGENPDFAVHILGENHTENPTPKEQLTSKASRAEAVEVAYDYMRSNPEGY